MDALVGEWANGLVLACRTFAHGDGPEDVPRKCHARILIKAAPTPKENGLRPSMPTEIGSS